MVVVELGKPAPIAGDVLIAFRGSGRARFCLQHARDAGGFPDDLSWTDITVMSDSRIEQKRLVMSEPEDGRKGVLRGGVMVDYIEGDTNCHYRRHTAGWLRVIASDYQDEEERQRCTSYHISMEPTQ